MKFTDTLKEWRVIIASISAIIFITVSSYAIYLDIYKSIEYRANQIELTQMSILKSQIKYIERYPCKVTRDEWAEYNMLFSQYYRLLKKHNPLLSEANFKPMSKLNKDSCKCYNGKGECND